MPRRRDNQKIRVRSGYPVHRRNFNRYLLRLAASAACPKEALVASRSLVVANYGGNAVTAFEKSYADFSALSGLRLLIGGSDPSEDAIKTQVNSGAVRWDVCDGEMYSSYRLGRWRKPRRPGRAGRSLNSGGDLRRLAARHRQDCGAIG